MLKKFLKVIKKIIVSFLIIYAYNVLATPINATIPINFVTVMVVFLLGIPSFAGLICMMLMFF